MELRRLAPREASQNGRNFSNFLAATCRRLVARMERSVIRGQPIPDYAEFIIGPAGGRTRLLHPGYEHRQGRPGFPVPSPFTFSLLTNAPHLGPPASIATA